MKDKLYVVRLYIRAKSAAAAIKKVPTTPVDDVWIDDEWKKGQVPALAEAVGFHNPMPKLQE